VAAAAAGSAASIGGAPAADKARREVCCQALTPTCEACKAASGKPIRLPIILPIIPAPTPPSPPSLPPLLISPTPPKGGRSGQECAGDYGSKIVARALQCPQAKPKCVGYDRESGRWGVCTTLRGRRTPAVAAEQAAAEMAEAERVEQAKRTLALKAEAEARATAAVDAAKAAVETACVDPNASRCAAATADLKGAEAAAAAAAAGGWNIYESPDRENVCEDGNWYRKPDKPEKDCKWVGIKPLKRCGKEDAFGRKAKNICVAACVMYYDRCG